MLSRHAPEPKEVENAVVIKAVLVADAPNLDIALWNKAVDARVAAGL
jgi:hypothetical protein